jgi:drug/metabolite transporter (DMT)-like permease
MTNAKPRLALAEYFVFLPILVKLRLTPGLISAFTEWQSRYRCFYPMCSLQKLKLPNKQIILAVLCGVLFSDVAVWNIAIQNSSATQASLLVNLAPLWVGIISYVFLNTKPATNFWIGTTVALFGICWSVLNFLELDFDTAFLLAVLAGVLYRYIY